MRVASVFRGREAESTNVELKACDPSCNPYLALGGLILAGLDGVRRRLEPPEPVLHDPASLTPDEQARHGIRPLPDSLREALADLQADPVLFPALGDLLGRCIIAVRTSEADALERSARTRPDWLTCGSSERKRGMTWTSAICGSWT